MKLCAAKMDRYLCGTSHQIKKVSEKVNKRRSVRLATLQRSTVCRLYFWINTLCSIYPLRLNDEVNGWETYQITNLIT